MPTIYVRIQHNSQQGYQSTGENYTNGGLNYGIKTDRVDLFRFTHVAIPKGSTITTATLHAMISVKNNTAQSFTYRPYLDLSPVSAWLDTTKAEYFSGTRTWSSGATAIQTFNWNTSGADKQLVSMDVKAPVQELLAISTYSLAGASMTFSIAFASVTNADQIYFHTSNDGFSPILEINYTPPASDGKDTVVNIQENGTFNRTTNNAGSFDVSPHGFNDWFGTYATPTYSVVTTTTSEVLSLPPSGGKMLRIQAGSGRSMVHFGVPQLEDGEWYNYSCYTYIPSTAPSDMGAEIVVLGDTPGSGSVTTKGAWVRHSVSFIYDGNGGSWGTVHTTGTTWNSTAVMFVAGVQLTKGKILRPYIDGNKVVTNADYGWAGTNANGFVRAVPPTASLTTQYDKARRKYFAVNWSYSNSAGHTQDAAVVKIRKVR